MIIEDSKSVGIADRQDGGGVFLTGAEMATSARSAGKWSFPWWRLQGWLPSPDEVRYYLGLEPPVCDSSGLSARLFSQDPVILRFSRTADRSTQPDTVVAGAGYPLCTPRDIATSPDGKLYVLDLHPRSAALDPRLQALIKVYDNGVERDDEPDRVFAVAADAIAMTVDGDGRVWTTSRAPRERVRVYDRNAGREPAPSRVIEGAGTNVSDPGGIAVDRHGNSYVISGDEVLVYSADAGGDTAPLRRIAGPDTQLRSPTDLALGAGDSLYVLNAHGKWGVCRNHGPRHVTPAEVTVTVYPPGADGNVKPVRRIVALHATEGAWTTSARPSGLAVDESGAVYARPRTPERSRLGRTAPCMCWGTGADGSVSNG